MCFTFRTRPVGQPTLKGEIVKAKKAKKRTEQAPTPEPKVVVETNSTGIYTKTTYKAEGADTAGMKKVFGKAKEAFEKDTLEPTLEDFDRIARKVLERYVIRWENEVPVFHTSNKPPVASEATTVVAYVGQVRHNLKSNDIRAATMNAIRMATAFERMGVRPHEPFVEIGQTKTGNKSAFRWFDSHLVGTDLQRSILQYIEFQRDVSLYDLVPACWNDPYRKDRGSSVKYDQAFKSVRQLLESSRPPISLGHIERRGDRLVSGLCCPLPHLF